MYSAKPTYVNMNVTISPRSATQLGTDIVMWKIRVVRRLGNPAWPCGS